MQLLCCYLEVKEDELNREKIANPRFYIESKIANSRGFGSKRG
jgi:hypothetical protein